MMIQTVQCLYYSATATTQKILDAVAQGTGLELLPSRNLAFPDTRKAFTGEVDSDLLIIGSAVYEGSIPFIAMEPFLKLEGEGKWAVVVGVYGNRSPEGYVSELSGLLRDRGFKIIAGVEFPAEHSFYHTEIGVTGAVGRPDKADLDEAYSFGEKIAEKLRAPTEAGIDSKPLKFGDQYKDREHWVGERLKMMIKGPNYDAEKCIQCNKCVVACPVEAVDASTYETDSDSCIKCMACVKICPTYARSVNYPPQVSQFMMSWGAERKKPVLLL